jgi:cytochrome c-type biogenesis protein CcsB
MNSKRFVLFGVLGLALGLTFAAPVQADPTPREGWSFREMGTLPIQAGGRIKPFDSYARDLVLQITGRRSFEGWDPVELVLNWLSDPKGWDTKAFIMVTRRDVKRQLGLNEDLARFSPKELLIDSFLAEYANSMGQARPGMTAQSTPIARTSKPDARDAELKTLFERVSVFRAIIAGDAWPVIPVPAPGQWGNLSLGAHHGEDIATALNHLPGKNVREAYVTLFTGYMTGSREKFDAGVKAAHGAVTAEMHDEWNPSSEKALDAELFYNRMHPFQIAWIFYLLAALLWAISIWLSAAGVTQIQSTAVGLAKKFSFAALPATFIAMALHVFGMGLRCYIAGRPPVTNMYESIVWVSFGVMLFATVLWFIQKNSIIFAVSTALSAIMLIVSDAAPAMIDSAINPLVPVLRSNYWLLIHVLTITLSYAAFALTLGLGNVSLWFFFRGQEHDKEGAKKIATLNQLCYRAMQFGVVLVAAGTILGGIWADYSWGRFWGWDPKEVWALIVLLGYIAVLHARFTGWIRPFGFAAWTVISFTLVMMAWYGVNFVLGVGLHSYGFSTGGQSSVALFVALQLGYVAMVAISRKRRMRATAAPSK